MNFVLFENIEGEESFTCENGLENLPSDTIAFTYFQQDNIDENGIVQSCEFRIGIPVKFIIGDMYIELDTNTANSQKDDIYCLYSQNGKRKFNPINQNTTLVNNFSELEEVFAALPKKQQARKR